MARVSRLPPALRRTFQIVGPLLLLVGIGLFLSNFLLLSGFLSGDPDALFADFVTRAVGGMVLMGVGGFLTQLGFMRLASELVATETAGAVEHGATALGRGAGQGLKESGWNPVGQVVKVRCRTCGFLDSEDARFCSGCGTAM